MKETLNSLNIKLVAIFTFINVFTYGQKNNLQVELIGFENLQTTEIFVSVFNKENFLEQSIETKAIKVSGDKLIVEFNLPPGEYAVSTYHDVNKNGELDRRFYGKPKEPYGFSQNIRPFGKPGFDKCKFKVENSLKIIPITLIN